MAAVSAFVRILCAEVQAAAATTELPRSLRKELKELLEAILAIQLPILETLEELPSCSVRVGAWLSDIKQAAYDAHDLLDLLPLRAQQPTVPRCCLVLFRIWRETIFSKNWFRAHAIKAVRKRVEGLVRSPPHDDFHLHRRIEGLAASVLVKSGVFGRDEDREQLVQMLTSEESAEMELSLVAIVGRGGVGKTMLARLVYDDQRVAAHFELKVWITASEIYDEERLLRAITESVAGFELREDVGIDRVVDTLMGGLGDKKFLLVLHDLRLENVRLERVLCDHLNFALSGSKVLVMTDKDEILKALQVPSSSYHLKSLSFEDCWLLFRTCTGLDQAPSERIEGLEAIAKAIVMKLGGLPFSAKMVGSLLCSNFEQNDWKVVLDSDIWDLHSEEDGLPSALWLSYQHLPPHIKQCLAHSAMVPKGHKFEKDRSIHLWMAQGLIQPQEGAEMEDVGSQYFDYLVSRSFFECSNGKHIMHDLVHDLAVAITIDESASLSLLGVGSSFMASRKVRHLSLLSDNLGPSQVLDSGVLNRLRTLIWYRTIASSFDYDASFIKLKFIRVICVSDMGLKELPDSIGNLKLLRCLDLSDTSVTMVPKRLCVLSNLQTLKLSAHEDALQKLPRCMSNLISLRQLTSNRYQTSRIYHIGKLTSLQELEEFTVSRKDGRRIEELKDMAQLRGQLCISRLENVHTEEEAKEGMLNDKKHLQKLELKWTWNYGWDGTPREVDDAVLEGLRPHPNLKWLGISFHGGDKVPSWLRDGSLSELETLEITDCKNWDLALLGPLQFLKSLIIEGLPKLQWVGRGDGQMFPKLRELNLTLCSGLQGVSPLPLTLVKLELRIVGLPVLPTLLQSVSSSTTYSALISLHIAGCDRLETLRVGLLEHQNQRQLQVLVRLYIEGCHELTHLPDHGFSGLVSLKFLLIEKCPKLSYLPGNGNPLPSSLADLRIIKCPALANDSFFMSLRRLHSLSFMMIKGELLVGDDRLPEHPLLTSLPGELLQHLTALEELEIADCEWLVMLGFGTLVCLKRLKIASCPKLLASSSPFDKAPLLLEYLEIKGSPLQMLSGKLLESFKFLQELQICESRDLVSFPDEVEEGLHCLSSLKRLHLYECYRLQSLPRELGSIPSLEELYLTACAIQSIPEKGVPASLAILVINNCPALEKKCKVGGEDWPKIAHVFYISINNRQVRTEALSEMSSPDLTMSELDELW